MGRITSESARRGGTTQTVKTDAIVSKTNAEPSMMPTFGESLIKVEWMDWVAYWESLITRRGTGRKAR